MCFHFGFFLPVFSDPPWWPLREAAAPTLRTTVLEYCHFPGFQFRQWCMDMLPMLNL